MVDVEFGKRRCGYALLNVTSEGKEVLSFKAIDVDENRSNASAYEHDDSVTS